MYRWDDYLMKNTGYKVYSLAEHGNHLSTQGDLKNPRIRRMFDTEHTPNYYNAWT